jgi:hypothetical protein
MLNLKIESNLTQSTITCSFVMLFLTIRIILIRISLKGIWYCLLPRNWCSCFCWITIPYKISLNPPINLPSMCQWMNETLLRLIENTKEKFIFEVLEYCNTFIVIFNLWISKVGIDHLCFHYSFYEPRLRAWPCNH